MKWQASQSLPRLLYSASQTRALDRLAIEGGIDGYELMKRAGEAAFSLMRYLWPKREKVLVCCGSGNNAGDGYVLATMAASEGYEVEVLSLVDTASLAGEARLAHDDFAALGLPVVTDLSGVDWSAAIIIDALLGTGLERPVAGVWAETVERINNSDAKVLSLDIPSGIHADSGAVLGTAVRAGQTISFIGLNSGLFTGMAPDFTGIIHFADLGVTGHTQQQVSPQARRISLELLRHSFPDRGRTDHKGKSGRVLVAGGSPGYAGAAAMTAMAAVRAGAGLTSVLTGSSSIAAIAASGPEIMVHDADIKAVADSLVSGADVIILGPGLGQSAWAQQVFARIVDGKPALIVDADGLTLLANNPMKRDDWVLTPHPGEAAKLLAISAGEVQQDRLEAATAIASQYGGVCVLKGAGTVVSSADAVSNESVQLAICNAGSGAMATGGMGDVLAGIIGSLVAQGLNLQMAAELGVAWHAHASDCLVLQGLAAGQLPSDLTTILPQLR